MLLQRFPRLQDWWRYYWAVPRGGGGGAGSAANRGRPHSWLQLAKMRHKMIHIGTNYSHCIGRLDFGGFSEPSYRRLDLHHPLWSFVSVASAEVKSEPFWAKFDFTTFSKQVSANLTLFPFLVIVSSYENLSNCCRHIRMSSQFHKFSETNFGSFLQFVPLKSAVITTDEFPIPMIVSSYKNLSNYWRHIRMSSQFHKFSESNFWHFFLAVWPTVVRRR